MSSPVLRNKSIGTKVSDEEYASLEVLAQARGVTVGEWCREVMLAQLHSESLAHPESGNAIDEALLEEILGLRLILLNAVFALSNGDRLGAAEMKELIRKADAEKLSAAHDRLRQLRSKAESPER